MIMTEDFKDHIDWEQVAKSELVVEITIPELFIGIVYARAMIPYGYALLMFLAGY